MDIKERVGSYLVSTVKLSISPYCYETMVFAVKGTSFDYNDLYCARCSTEGEAQKMHLATVEAVKSHRLP